MGSLSGFGKRPDGRNSVCRKRFHGRLRDRDHSDCFSDRIEDFEGVAVFGVFTRQVFDNRRDIAPTKPILRQIDSQRDSFKEINFHYPMFLSVFRVTNSVSLPSIRQIQQHAVRIGETLLAQLAAFEVFLARFALAADGDFSRRGSGGGGSQGVKILFGLF